MVDQQFKEYKKLFRYLNLTFLATGYRLTDKKPETTFKGLVTNFFFWMIVFTGLFVGYLILFEESSPNCMWLYNKHGH